MRLITQRSYDDNSVVCAAMLLGLAYTDVREEATRLGYNFGKGKNIDFNVLINVLSRQVTTRTGFSIHKNQAAIICIDDLVYPSQRHHVAYYDGEIFDPTKMEKEADLSYAVQHASLTYITRRHIT